MTPFADGIRILPHDLFLELGLFSQIAFFGVLLLVLVP
jgi:hypothetical protein